MAGRAGGGGHLGTYQRSHPLEEVDALPVIDVVGLPALPGTRRGDSQAPASRTPPADGPAATRGQTRAVPFQVRTDQLCDPVDHLTSMSLFFLSFFI